MKHTSLVFACVMVLMSGCLNPNTGVVSGDADVLTTDDMAAETAKDGGITFSDEVQIIDLYPTEAGTSEDGGRWYGCATTDVCCPGAFKIFDSWCNEDGTATYVKSMCFLDYTESDPSEHTFHCPDGCVDGGCVTDECTKKDDGEACGFSANGGWLGICHKGLCCNFGDRICQALPSK